MGIRAARCSNCGREVRGLQGARKEEGRWYCSQSCLLQAESSGARTGSRGGQRGPRPVRAIRVVVKWTLIVLGLLVALGSVLAAVGVGTDSGRSGYGSESHPVPLRHGGSVWGGWHLRVLSATPRALQVVA